MQMTDAAAEELDIGRNLEPKKPVYPEFLVCCLCDWVKQKYHG